jgi:hypothetical protein
MPDIMRAARREYLEFAERRLNIGSQVLQARLRNDAPVKTSRMQRSVWCLRRGRWRVRVLVEVPYATYTTRGTRPHVIRPRRARALRFVWPKAGPPQPKFFAKVNHPGTPPNDWYDRNIERWPAILENIRP